VEERVQRIRDDSITVQCHASRFGLDWSSDSYLSKASRRPDCSIFLSHLRQTQEKWLLADVFRELRSLRLQLRPLCPDDALAICDYRSLPEVARYQCWESCTLDEAAQLIAGQTGLVPDTPGTWFQLGIVNVASGQLVGDCGLHFRLDEPRQVELGITLAPAHQGSGFAAEALHSVLEYVFASLGKHRVSAVTDVENRAAASLFRKLGFRREGHFVEHVWFKGAWSSEYLFALLHREWQERRPETTPLAALGPQP
jgi:RimJ/RimL family protein N-acetyltransferase